MSPRPKTFALLLVAASLILPGFALRAQQPEPSTAKASDAAKAKDTQKAAETKATPKASDVARIIEEGTTKSQVMATLSYLTDVIGPRLTGSPGLKRANEWTRDKLTSYGLANAHLEAWGPFGRGWTLKSFSAQVVEPQCIPLIAYPKAWSPGTEGKLTAPLLYLDAKTESDLAKFKGNLKGKVVLLSPPVEVPAHFEAQGSRLTDKQLLDLADSAPFGEPGQRPRRQVPPASPNPTPTPTATPGTVAATTPPPAGPLGRLVQAVTPPNTPAPATPAGPGGTQPQPGLASRFAALAFNGRKLAFCMDEGAAAVLTPSTIGDGGTIFVAQASVPGAPTPTLGGGGGGGGGAPGARRKSAWDKDLAKNLIQVAVAKEHYNRLVRMIEAGERLTLALDLAVEFHDADPMAYNTVAEIPGTDLKDEVVMLGGHMDSWHAGTGATDNAAGCAVGMEAVRILKALDLKPRRTIRIALWSGEEQGLFGSKAYVKEHFGELPAGGANTFTGGGGRPARVKKLPDYDKFSAYFNLDNGTGKVRGVYLQGNEAVRPLFRQWLAPFRDMGATTLSASNTGGTDHLSFDAIGLPGFQFIQDEIEYDTRTHHSNQDLYDRAQADDLKQAATVMASFIYNTANLDQKLPRKGDPADAK